VRESRIVDKTESEKGRKSPKLRDNGNDSDLFETNRSKDRKLNSTLQPGKNRENDVQQANKLEEFYK
jgi:hypothetical protein